MNPLTKSTLLSACLCSAIHGQITIPSDGSDGPFSPATDIEVDLTQAIPGVWSDDNAGADIGKGIYDKDQWAIVFEYSSVNIPEDVTVTFKNHPSNPPVIWLVSGDVTIDGTLSLEGESEFDSGLSALNPNNGGPGGFRSSPAGRAPVRLRLRSRGPAPGGCGRSTAGPGGRRQLAPAIDGKDGFC